MKKTTTKPAKQATPAASQPGKSQFKTGDDVQFYCPTARRVIREKVKGHVHEHGWVTLESGRHFPAKEISHAPDEA